MYWVTGGEEQYGSTMWKLDEQNVPVKIAGLDNSEISNFSILSTGIYFWKSTDGVGRQPWVLTGTGLPRKFADVEAGNDWGWSDFTELNGKIFAVAAERLIVMSSNGTVSYEPSGVSGVQDIVKVGSYMYFTGWSDADGKGTEIYRWNGTGAAEFLQVLRPNWFRSTRSCISLPKMARKVTTQRSRWSIHDSCIALG
jgi:hypothetical protein